MSTLTENDRHRLLVEWNDTRVLDRRDASVPQLFDEIVRQHPDAVAVEDERTQVTYRDLQRRANRLARYLRARAVGADVRVALCLERTPETIVAILAILKAGGAYVPIDALYPRERIAFMLEDASAAVLVTQSSLRDRLGEFQNIVQVDRESAAIALEDESDIDAGVAGDALAYVMYTSGSTGRPKGVEVVHRAINRLVRHVSYVRLGSREVLLHAAPLAFDASTFEIWGALLLGGRIVLYRDAVPTARGLRECIDRHGVTVAWLTAALFNSVVDDDPRSLAGLKQLLIGGEALSVSHVRKAQAALDETQIINGYGPTEATTFACCYPIPHPLGDVQSIPIGRPIRDTRVYVLDADRQLVPIGELGELYIGGDGLARGYLARPELTAERFVPDPFQPGERLYRTGDVVRFLPDGSIEFAGRADAQVKIRGYRIELGEIEAALTSVPHVKSAVVVAREDTPGLKRLVAYVVAAPRPGGVKPRTSELRDALGEVLPTFMVPSTFVWLDALPLTPNGKLDQRALPAPSSERPDVANAYEAPKNDVERSLCALWSDALGVSPVGATDNVFDLGATSLLAVRVALRARQELGLSLSPIAVFEHPTPRELAAALSRRAPEEELALKVERYTRRPREGRSDVAIVGMVGRFPGATSVEDLWRVLCEGRDTIRHFRDDELDPYIPAATRNDPAYVKARGILDDVELFDAGFFAIPPKEAEVMDPQQRVLLELAWEALEDSGHVPETFDGRIGVFAGKYNDTYWSENVVTRSDLVQAIGAFQAMVANEKDYVATRIAHKLDLTGPALSIHTACSTSLVAIAQAVRSLRAGECDLALAGGVSITVPVRSGYSYQDGAMLSNDGHTRSFDEGAKGTVFSDGAGIVVLRRVEDALGDGDTIRAIVRGVAVNNDGATKASFTAPSVDGQATVVAMAHADGGIDPRSISYVEAHGTATPLGDPIEVEALTRAFRTKTSDTGFCSIGSIKSNIGHTVIAAGVAGVIKTALALEREMIPASLHFQAPNPKIDFANGPFRVNSELRPWPRGGSPRRAGVSSFGVGGTNAHAVLEEGPPLAPMSASRPMQALLISARSPAAVQTAAAALSAHLAAHPGTPLADVAFTLHTGRRHFRYRRVVVAADAREGAQRLASPQAPASAREAHATEPAVVLMFPGQGAQYVGMGASLYRDEPVFRHQVDRCAEGLRGTLDRDLREILMPSADNADLAAASLRETRFTQPALFAVSYALARLWESWGVRPRAMVGHSIGEFVCAVLAGVMSVEDALGLVGARGRLMFDQPPGDMLSVRAPAVDLAPLLGPELSIASDNGPSLCVVSGPPPGVASLRVRLEQTGIVCKPLHTSHAFHSPMMDAIVEPFTRLVSRVPLAAPRIPFVSTLTGTWITSEQSRDPSYWGRHLRETVRFAAAARTALSGTFPSEEGAPSEPAGGAVVLLEAGPRSTLAVLARQQITDKVRQTAIASLGDSEQTEWSTLLSALGALWCTGVKIESSSFWRGQRRRRTPLPTYPFERQRFWIDPARAPSEITRPIVSPRAADPERAPVRVGDTSLPSSQESPVMPSSASTRVARLADDLRQIFEDASGIEIGEGDLDTSFLELGLDSLFLTQVAIAVQKKTAVKVNFRLLIEQTPTIRALSEYLDDQLPPDSALGHSAPSDVATAAPVQAAAQIFTQTIAIAPTSSAPAGTIQWVIEQQLQLMTKQLAALQGGGASIATSLPDMATATRPNGTTSAPSAAVPSATPASKEVAPKVQTAAVPADDTEVVKKPFGAIARISLNADGMTPRQRARLDSLTRRYTSRTNQSKQWTQDHRAVMADPRVVTGFRPAIKELIYPIVIDRSAGARLWDIDGNEYIDTLMGFGCNMFGWQPDFVTRAVEAQLRSGHEIGPQTRLAGECAKLVCEFTGFDRAAFCNTGSEAVMGTMRIARTVTGRTKIALFTGSYHGIFDEVIVRGTKKLRSIPAAPGIMRSTSENVLVLDYGTPESLDILRSQADQLAAILVEPVQSRRPEFQPREYLHQLRELTQNSGTVLIFDEVITGFRTSPGGAQEYFGVRADLASYGKVIGGGHPIGVIAGKRAYMDALDGGHWEFGDASVPTVGVTYFAGTFVRHPLALAAVKAVLLYLKEKGPEVQRETNAKAARLAAELNAFFREAEAPLEIRHFGSLWKTFPTGEHPSGDLLFVMLRDRGIHIMDGFPCFFTTAHTQADIDAIVAAFKSAVAEMQESGFFPEPTAKTSGSTGLDASRPPAAGARLGRDADGKPAWFVPNPNEPGGYLRVETLS